jgi:hypothetical protein
MRQIEEGTDGVFGIRVIKKMIASSVTLPPGEQRELPDGAADIPEVRRDIARRNLRMRKLPTPADASPQEVSAPSPAKLRTRRSSR